jgi:prophage antirepressor-like protein
MEGPDSGKGKILSGPCNEVPELDVFNAFVKDGMRYEIDIIWREQVPLFKASDIGAVLGMPAVRSSVRSYDNDEKVVVLAPSPGGPQYCLFLTERGVYRLLMQLRKRVARPFQKWVVSVIEHIKTRGRYDLEQEVNAAKAELEQEREKRVELLNTQAEILRHAAKVAAKVAKHEVFVSLQRKGDCLVYFGKIREEEDGRLLIKIGSTKDLHERANGLAKTFGLMAISAVFPASLFRQFEEFLHTHPSIASHVFKEVIHDGHSSNREVFLMDEVEVANAVALAKRHAPAYNDRATVEQIVEYELTKYKGAVLEA